MANQSPKSHSLTLLLVAIVLVFLLSFEGYEWFINRHPAKEAAPATIDINQILNETQANITTPTIQDNTASSEITEADPTSSIANPASAQSPNSAPVKPLPTSLNLEVAFYTQAPFSNWDYPWQEACEEASSLLAANTYLKHNWTREQFNEQILSLVDWEKATFGDYKHTTVAQTAVMLDHLGLKTVIHENPSYEDVREILSHGHLIVMTFAGKHLGNPNYKNGGPNYHAMLIKGYDDNGQKIITNDVGTRNGENYVYTWTTIQNSLHDYAVPIEKGDKRIIEVLPPTEK